MYEDSLTHYGVLGMKWGRRKSISSKSSNVKKSSKYKKQKQASSAKKTTKKIVTDSRKETIKTIAKSTAKVSGAVAVTALLGALGYTAWDYAVNSGQFRSVTTYGFSGVKDFDRDQVKVENNRGREISGPLDEDFLRRHRTTGKAISRSLRL